MLKMIIIEFMVIFLNFLDKIIFFFIFDLLGGSQIQTRILHFFYKRNVGEKVYIKRYTRFSNMKNIRIENNVFLNEGCYLNAESYIHINQGTWIAQFVKILTATHEVSDMKQTKKEVTIGKYCWIGANAIILPGITIGDFSVIGAGSVVVKDIPSYSVAVGNPAKVIKKREISFPYYIPGGKIESEF